MQRIPPLVCLLLALAACGDDEPTKATTAKVEHASYTETIPPSQVSFDMVWVEAGGFWIGKHEVTWDEYELFYLEGDTVSPNTQAVARPSKSYHPHDRGWGRGRRPACGVTRHAAQQYCAWLSRATGKTYQLPTRDQWQLAARAGRTGDAPPDLATRGWTASNAENQTHPVGEKQPNPLGLHDMFGNVMEWLRHPAAGEDEAGSLAGGAYASSGPDLRYDTVTPFQFEWHEADPQRPRSPWWLCDGPVTGFRLLRVP